MIKTASAHHTVTAITREQAEAAALRWARRTLSESAVVASSQAVAPVGTHAYKFDVKLVYDVKVAR